MIWVIVIVAAVISAALLKRAIVSVVRREGSPVLLRGRIPFVGVALEFGKDAVSFLKKQMGIHGDVFSLLVAGRKMTFLCDVKYYGIFFESDKSTMSFEEAVQTFTERYFVRRIKELNVAEHLEPVVRRSFSTIRNCWTPREWQCLRWR
jgi:prostacyclin synthase